MKLFVFVLAVSTFLTLPVCAWNNVGHRTIAELAWRQMTADERKGASDLLKQHPHYKELLARDFPKGVDHDEWVFLNAAVWPDWVRPAKSGQDKKPESITQYDVYPHGIGYPFLRSGETNQALLNDFFIAKPNAEMVLANSLATLRDEKASAHDRAVSLCWVLHLMGDLHQPLHTANQVTKEKPRGEGLGGSHIVLDPRNRSHDKRTNLHSFWDQLPGVTLGYETISKLADQLMNDPALKPTSLEEYREDKTIASWVQEGYRASVDFAYSEKHVQYVYEDDLRSKKIPASEIPILSTGYIEQAQKVAHKRLVLAGQRLADELKQVW